MDFVKVVNDKRYQSAFTDNFIFEGGGFVGDEHQEKSLYLFLEATDPASVEHNKLIEDGYLFYKWDTGALFLLKSSKSENYLGTVFYVDDECSVYAVGNSPFDFADNLGDSIVDVHRVVDKNAFFRRCQELFGDIERRFIESEAESNLYGEYPELA